MSSSILTLLRKSVKERLSKKEIEHIAGLSEEFPWFALPKLILARQANDEQSEMSAELIKRAAFYATNRSLFKQYIESGWIPQAPASRTAQPETKQVQKVDEKKPEKDSSIKESTEQKAQDTGKTESKEKDSKENQEVKPSEKPAPKKQQLPDPSEKKAESSKKHSSKQEKPTEEKASRKSTPKKKAPEKKTKAPQSKAAKKPAGETDLPPLRLNSRLDTIIELRSDQYLPLSKEIKDEILGKRKDLGEIKIEAKSSSKTESKTTAKPKKETEKKPVKKAEKELPSAKKKEPAKKSETKGKDTEEKSKTQSKKSSSTTKKGTTPKQKENKKSASSQKKNSKSSSTKKTSTKKSTAKKPAAKKTTSKKTKKTESSEKKTDKDKKDSPPPQEYKIGAFSDFNFAMSPQKPESDDLVLEEEGRIVEISISPEQREKFFGKKSGKKKSESSEKKKDKSKKKSQSKSSGKDNSGDRKGKSTPSDEKKKDLKKTNEIIDRIIEEEPRLSDPKTYKPKRKDIGKDSIEEKDDMISATLAEIHAKQGNTQKAVEIYKRLSLLFPDKKAFFASRIEKLQEK